MDRLNAQQQTSRQQIEFYTLEYQAALDNMKTCSSKLTEDILIEFSSLENPSQTIQEIACKTILVLHQSQPEPSFSDFQILASNYPKFRDLICQMPNEILSDVVINEILPIWKNQAYYQSKVARTSKAASILAQWLGFTVEFSLKKSTVLTSKRKDPELQKKIKVQTDILKDLAKDIHYLKEKIALAQKALKDFEAEQLIKTAKSAQGDRKSMGSTSHRRSLSNFFGSVNLQNFPNFNDDELYGDIQEQSIIEDKMKLEGNEPIGCCRMRFFCF